MYPDNSSTQVMHCRCPKNSVAYLVKRHAYNTDSGMGYQFSFACSPQTVSLILSLHFLTTIARVEWRGKITKVFDT